MTEVVLFDYGQLDVETRIVVQQRASEIKTLTRRTVSDAIEIGLKLIDAKDRLGHGRFTHWVSTEFNWQRTTAYKFMIVADKFANVQGAEHLTMSFEALAYLAGPSTPEPARIEAIQRAEAGEDITHTAAKAIVAQHKPPTPADPPSREYHTAIIEPEPLRHATPPSRPLTDAEAEAVVWRVLNRHADPGKAIMPKAAEIQRDWLIKADWGLFRAALTDGVRFDHGQLMAMINRVKEELERKIDYFSVNFAVKPEPAPPAVGDEVGDAAKKEGDSDENYTPYYIIKAAREVLGKIDLDPASCKEAQDLVRATSWLGKATNSLQPKIPWLGRIWLNPPYSMTLPFVAKAFAEYDKGNIRAGIILTNNGTETEWGQMLLSRCPVCFFGFNGAHGSRISFWQKSPDEPRRGNRYAQMISYLGPDVEKFAEVFSQFGVIKR